MSNDTKKITETTEEEQGGESGSQTGGGATGEIGFHYKDAMSVGPRDDQLPEVEIKRLLIVHKDLHKAKVDKQKRARKDYRAKREGKVVFSNEQFTGLQQGNGGGMAQATQNHPLLMSKAQFSGMPAQVNGLPNLNKTNTNEEKRNEFAAENRLENRLENRNELRLQSAPRYTPKLRPY